VVSQVVNQQIPIDFVMRQDADWVIEISGFLGIINILGAEHLVVLVGKDEVCRLPHKHQPSPTQMSIIYELQDIELIPFRSPKKLDTKEQQLRSIREGLKRYLECGFYFSHTLDLTSNAQRRERHPPSQQQSPYSSLDKRYMWNYNLY